MAHTIRPTDVGKRVTLQFFDDAGARTEVVGILERTELVDGEPVLHVRRKDDTLVTVPIGRIRAGRVVDAPRRK
jgi:hypothetical protein